MHQRLVLPAWGIVIAERVTVARSSAERAKGLLGTASLEAGHCLALETRQVHTVGMRYPIDVVFCCNQGKVRHIVRSMPPMRVSRFVLRARVAYELPAGAADAVAEGAEVRLERSAA